MNTLSFIIEKSINKLTSIFSLNEAKSLTYRLIEDLLYIERHLIPLNLNERLTESELLKIIRAYKRLLENEPIDHILGFTEFRGMKFKVNKETLIPRPETEELIDLVKSLNTDFKSIIDIGTGTGCIPISLKAIYPESNIIGIDLFENVLDIAKHNSAHLQYPVNFKQKDILKEKLDDSYDLIISNPPYIKPSEKKLMHKNVLDFEPHSALFIPEDDPLLFYRRIVNLAKDSLIDGGYLFFEINENHGPETLDLIMNDSWKNQTLQKDFLGKDRFVFAQKAVNKKE